MKTIDSIIIHCSATRFGQDLRAKDTFCIYNRLLINIL